MSTDGVFVYCVEDSSDWMLNSQVRGLIMLMLNRQTYVVLGATFRTLA